MSTTHKKVIVRQWNGELHRGYLPMKLLAPGGHAELLLPDARALDVSVAAIKHIAFVRDFNLMDSYDPERIGLRAFRSKPRNGGAWVEVLFTDGDRLEGFVGAGLALLDTCVLEQGIFLDPPDKHSNTHRLFIPRCAMSGFELLGVAGPASKEKRTQSPVSAAQRSLFGGSHEE